MEFLGQRSAADTQWQVYRWQVYRQLELLPDSVTSLDVKNARFTFGLNWVWRRFISLLVEELAEEERITEYLDRCWSLDTSGEGDNSAPNSLKRLWALMD